MGIFLWATWAHEYMAIFIKMYGHHMSGCFLKSWRYVILTKLGQHVNEMISEFLVVTFSYNQTKR